MAIFSFKNWCQKDYSHLFDCEELVKLSIKYSILNLLKLELFGVYFKEEGIFLGLRY